MASKLHTACGDTTLKNGAGKETMEFLKDILGEDLYKQVSDTVNAYNGKPENKDKQVKLADLGSGQYVDKGKYDTAVAEKENLAGQIKTLNTTIGDLKKNNADNETLQTTIANLQGELKKQQTASEEIAKTYALKDSLTKQGVLDPDYLILMDIKYDGVKFVYDDYACERFKRNLVDSLGDLQRKYAIRESMIKSLEDLNG